MNWKPIYRNSSLPYNEGEKFYARYNACKCSTEEPFVIKCLAAKPCIVKFTVINEFEFVGDYKHPLKSTHNYSKQGIITNFKYWKFIQPERSKREDSRCEMRCSEHCGNTVRDK